MPPEQYGKFRFYPPAHGDKGWSLSFQDQWLPIVLASREACKMLADLFTKENSSGKIDDLILLLNKQYNLAQPSVDVSCGHIMKHYPGAGDS